MDGYRGKNINIEVPDSVRYILKTIRGAGYEAYIVGGCVRDRLLGREPGDWDITTSALPEQVKGLFANTVDTGIQHGTVMVIRGGCGYEVTTYRVDGEYKDGRHPESVTFTPNLEEDLKRRDFTINAFAYDPEEGVVDLFDGIDDLDNGIVRAVGDPRKRFDEDALRIMRAVRFSAQLSFVVEEKTREAISEFATKLGMVSAERIRVEFEKTLFSDNPTYVNEFKELSLASYVVPEYSDKCFTEESATVLNNIPEAESRDGKILRLAAFFMGLDEDQCSDVMRKMTFDNRSRELVMGILRYQRENGETQGGLPKNELETRQTLRKTGEELYSLILQFMKAKGVDTIQAEAAFAEVIKNKDAYNLGMLAISGMDLIAMGEPQGRGIGLTLNRLLDIVIENPALNNKETLTHFIRGEK